MLRKSILVAMTAISILITFYAHADIQQKPIKVGIMLNQPPFSYEMPSKGYGGLTIKIWELIAKELKLDFEYVVLDTTYNGLVQAVYDRKVDVVVAPLSVTYKRMQFIDYSRPYFINNVGLAISVKPKTVAQVYSNSFITFFYFMLVGMCVCIVLIGPCLWMLETKNRNNPTSQSKVSALVHAFIASASIFVGGGIYKPSTKAAYMLQSILTILSLGFILGIFILQASALQLSSFDERGEIGSLADVKNKRVAIEKGSFVIDVAKGLGAKTVLVKNSLEGLRVTSEGKVDGFMGDLFLMRYIYEKEGLDNVKMASFSVANDEYAFAFESGSPLKDKVDSALVKIQKNKLAADACSMFLGEAYSVNCAF